MGNEDFKISIGFEDENVEKGLNAISKKAEGMGSSVKSAGAIGKLGLWSLGEQAEKAASSMGVPNKIGRQLGNTIEGLSTSLGTAATAFGIAGLAVTAGVSIYNAYENKQKEAREETEKLTNSLYDQTKQLYDNRLETDELRNANENLAKAARKEYLVVSAKNIKDEREEIAKLNKKLEDGMPWYQKMWAGWTAADGVVGGMARIKKAQEEYNTTLQNTINRKKAELAVDEVKRNAVATTSTTLSSEAMTGLSEGYASQAETEKLEKSYTRQATYLTKVDALWSAQDSNYSGHLDMQQAALDAQLQAKLTSMQANNATMEEYQQAWEDYVIASETKMAASRKSNWQTSLSTASSIISSLEEIESNYYDASNSSSKTHWRRYKQLKIAQATVSGITSVVKAYEAGSEINPYVGAAYAALAAAVVASKISSIRSTTWDGDSSSTSTVSSSTASTTAGMSGSSSSSQPVNIYVNGQRYSSLEITGSVVRELYRRGGSIDGYSVAVGKNA